MTRSSKSAAFLVSAVVVGSVLAFYPSAAPACTFTTSLNFREVARSVSVAIQFEGAPLAGVDVTVSPFDRTRPVSSALTGRDGTVRFRDLRPGKYYLHVVYLGIATFDQIEIRDRASQGQSRLDYRWGEMPVAVQQISGNIMDIQRRGATPFERLINPTVEVPIAGAQMQLRHPTNGSVYVTASDSRGEFVVSGVPNGIYVLRVDGGQSPQDVANVLIQIVPTATRNSLQFMRGDLCGGSILSLRF